MNNIAYLSNNTSVSLSVEDLRSHIRNLIGTGVSYKTLDSDWKINIIGNTDKINHLIKSSKYGKMNKSKQNRHKKYIANIETLIKNSKYTNNPQPNTKTCKKPNIAVYHYFKVNVNVKGTVYEVLLVTEQYKGESTQKPQIVHLYDVIEQKITSL